MRIHVTLRVDCGTPRAARPRSPASGDRRDLGDRLGQRRRAVLMSSAPKASWNASCPWMRKPCLGRTKIAQKTPLASWVSRNPAIQASPPVQSSRWAPRTSWRMKTAAPRMVCAQSKTTFTLYGVSTTPAQHEIADHLAGHAPRSPGRRAAGSGRPRRGPLRADRPRQRNSVLAPERDPGREGPSRVPRGRQ